MGNKNNKKTTEKQEEQTPSAPVENPSNEGIVKQESIAPAIDGPVENPFEEENFDEEKFLSGFVQAHKEELLAISQNIDKALQENVADNGYPPKLYFAANYERTKNYLRTGINFSSMFYVAKVRKAQMNDGPVVFTTLFMFIEGKWYPFSLVCPKFIKILEESIGSLFFVVYDGKEEKKATNSRGEYTYSTHKGSVKKIHYVKQVSQISLF